MINIAFNYKRLLAAVALTAVLSPLSAQATKDSIVHYFKSLTAFPQEKLYLHLDKPYYGAGENIWFRAYLLNAMTHRTNIPENFVTVELLNRKDSLLVRKKIARDSIGLCNALTIPATVPSGEYYVRGYSSWMQNVGPDFFFQRKLRIENAIDRNVQTTVTYTPAEKQGWNARFSFVKSDDEPYKQIIVRCRIYENNKLLQRQSAKTDDEGRMMIDLPDLSTDAKRRIEVSFDDKTYVYQNTFFIPDYSKNYSVQFFPEGGALLQGVSQKVAFKAQRADGYSCELIGALLNERGDTVSDLRTVHDGMGVMNFEPEAGMNYYAQFVSGDGVERRFPLPQAEASGMALSLVQRKGMVYFQIQKPDAMQFPKELYLVVHTRGKVFAVQPVSTAQPSGKFNAALLDNGISHFIVADQDGKVLSDRLFFHYAPAQEEWNVTAYRNVYNRRSKVELSVQLKDNQGRPLQGDFSMSITDGNAVRLDSLADNIVSNLLLTSDLKGYVEHPAYYFGPQNSEIQRDADLLMMTHGWCRHHFTNIAHWKEWKPEYKYEFHQVLSGKVTGLFGAKVKSGPIFAVSPKYMIMEEGTTDKDGRFTIPVAFQDSTSFFVQARTKNGFATVDIQVDKDKFPKAQSSFPYASETTDLPQNFLGNTMNQYYAEGGMKVVNLKELLVTAKSRKYSSIYMKGVNDKEYTTADLEESGQLTLYDALFWMPEIEMNDSGGLKILRCEGTPLIHINDFSYTYEDGVDFLQSLSVDEVETVTIVRGSGALMFSSDGGGGAIVVILKHPLDMPAKPIPGITTCTPLGYAKDMEFYHPDYDIPEQRNNPTPDQRNTLYWNPYLLLDAEGKARVSYFTSDLVSPHDIVIEGVTVDGTPVRTVQRINQH